MKVYELMNMLAEYPSGADVGCAITLTVSELENGSLFGEDDAGDDMYSVYKDLCSTEIDDNVVYLNI